MIEKIKEALLSLVNKYSIRSAILFGSRADGTNREDSDVDLIIKFNKPVSLLTLSSLKIELEELLHRSVDIIHGPVTDEDMLEINKEVVLYAA